MSTHHKYAQLIDFLIKERSKIIQPESCQTGHLCSHLVSFPLEGVPLMEEQEFFLEKLCYQMDVRKKLYSIYDNDFQKPMTQDMLSSNQQYYTIGLLILWGFFRKDFKYLNSAMKYMDVVGIHSSFPKIFDVCLKDFFNENA